MSTLKHVGIIMDGNGRWAISKNKPRTFGHLKGASVIPKIIFETINQKIPFLSLFAFSCENFKRNKREVDFLMELFLKKTTSKKTKDFLVKNNIRFKWIGFKQNLSLKLVNEMKKLERVTKNNNCLTLNLFINYGGRQDIYYACRHFNKKASLEEFDKFLLTKDVPNLDLLIRTGNEKRISNFMLWQSAYAELIFEKTLWPEYSEKIYQVNLEEYNSRKRRFGQ